MLGTQAVRFVKYYAKSQVIVNSSFKVIKSSQSDSTFTKNTYMLRPRYYPFLFTLILSSFSYSLMAQNISEHIKVNQIGYLTNHNKVCYVSDENEMEFTSWKIKEVGTEKVVYQSTSVSAGINDQATGEYVYMLEFSEFNDKGAYYIDVDNIGRSYEFDISENVYNEVFEIVMKGFYYQRSGVDLASQYAGKWAKPAEYADDAYLYLGYDGNTITKGEKIEASGGWRDAGDPNKKVVPASIATHQLLTLYEYYPTFIDRSQFNIPADDDFPLLPDFLVEVKVSLDWLLKMQRSDGAVWHAVGQEEFYLAGLGNQDPNPRYLMPVSTTATADFAAVMATAYRVFKNVDSAYANRCLTAAEKAWDALNEDGIWNNPSILGRDGKLKYPEVNGYSIDPPGINNTAVYTDTDDSDERHWAAGELAISTNKATYHNFFTSGIENGIWYPSLWPSVGNLANFSYARAFKDENNNTMRLLKGYLRAYMDLYMERMRNTGFGTSLSPDDYYWGSNNLAGQFAYTFLMSYDILGNEEYREAALSMLNYILGANSLNQSFISGVGDKPVENVFHLPSWLDGVDEVVPGLIPGGPNQFITSSDIVHAELIQTQNPPPAKCYVDSEFSFSSNEAVILESAVWAYVTGYFYHVEIDDDNDGYTIEDDCDDDNAEVNPDQVETVYNGVDDDCDATTLDDDLDQDGYVLEDDCDDNDSLVNPGKMEIPYNSLDDDCDPSTLDDDLDQDGFNKDADCDDSNPDINPDAEEIPNNGIDENCDNMDATSSLYDAEESIVALFPNPVTDVLKLKNTTGPYTVEIFSIRGHKMLNFILNNGNVDVSRLPRGAYIMKIEMNTQIHHQRFMKM